MSSRKKKVAIIESTLVPLGELKDTFKRLMPDVTITTFLDESLLTEMEENNRLTPDIIKRYCIYAVLAESIGSDMIFNQCSSIAESVDVAQRIVKIPILRTDLPMAEQAVETGKRIGIIATAYTTVDSTTNLIKKIARDRGKEVTIVTRMHRDAFLLQAKGDREEHNRILIESIKTLQNETDVIVLAQGSMAVLLADLKEIKVPVLTSLESGVLRCKEMLEKME